MSQNEGDPNQTTEETLNIIKESESIIIATSNYLHLTFKSLKNEFTEETFNEKVSLLSDINFNPILSINSYQYDNSISHLPTILLNIPHKMSALDTSRLTPTLRFKILLNLIFTFRFFIEKGIKLDPFTIDNILISADNTPYLYVTNFTNSNEDNVFQSIVSLIKTLCSNSNESEMTFVHNFYSELYSTFQNSHYNLSSIEGILDTFITSDLTTLTDNAEDAEEYLGQLLYQSFSAKGLLKLYRNAISQKRRINELNESIESIENEMRELNGLVMSVKRDDSRIDQLTIQSQEFQTKLDQSISLFQTLSSPTSRFEIPLETVANGIFATLINSQKSRFDHLVVPSQSSGDVYFIIDQNSTGNYSSGSGDYEWVQFDFKEPISIVSFQIQSAHRAFLKNWAVVAYDEDGGEITLYKTENDPALNGVDNKVYKTVKAVEAKSFRIEKFGCNWSGTNFMRIKNFEFFSDDPKYKGGVFKSLIEKANGDPHKADVYITASNFDFKRFHKICPSRSLCTLYDETQPWFQVELTCGRAIVHGYRLQMLTNFPLSCWRLAGSNDKENWDTIHDAEVPANKTAPILLFNCSSQTPYKYFRFINTENANDDLKLRLKHFDIFGVYLSD